MAKISIDSDIELEHYLELLFKGRFNADFTSSLDNHVHGTLDGERVVLTFWPHDSIILSAEKGVELEKLIPALSTAMDENGPICKYETKDYGKEESDAVHMEWDIKDPDKRLKELANDRAYVDGTEVVNMEVLNGKTVADYMDTEEERKEILANARIYGIDRGCIKPDADIEHLSEADLFLTIQSLGNMILAAKLMKALPFQTEEIDLTEEEYGMDYLLYQTKRFGVNISEPKFPRRILVSKEFEAWYKFYTDHFDSFTDEQWAAFKRLKDAGGDLTEFLPIGNWRDLLEQDKPAERKMRPGQTEDEE